MKRKTKVMCLMILFGILLMGCQKEVEEELTTAEQTSGFVDSSGYLIHHNGDGLHIDSKYNNQFYNNIFNAVKNAEK